MGNYPSRAGWTFVITTRGAKQNGYRINHILNITVSLCPGFMYDTKPTLRPISTTILNFLLITLFLSLVRGRPICQPRLHKPNLFCVDLLNLRWFLRMISQTVFIPVMDSTWVIDTENKSWRKALRTKSKHTRNQFEWSKSGVRSRPSIVAVRSIRSPRINYTETSHRQKGVNR